MNKKYSKLILVSIISSLLIGVYSKVISSINLNSLTFAIIASVLIIIQLFVHTYLGVKYILTLLNKNLRIHFHLVLKKLDADYSNLYNNIITNKPTLNALGVCRC